MTVRDTPTAAVLWPLVVTAAVLAGEPAQAVQRRAFVTSVTGSGNLSSWPDAAGQTGIAAGDAICRARANAAGLPNANAYRAWLSGSLTDAYCHVQGLGGTRASNCLGGTPAVSGPWYRWGPIAPSPATEGLNRLVDEGVIYRSFLYDENGDDLHEVDPDYGYWTGTRPDGTATDSTCDGWTKTDLQATRGSVAHTSGRWTAVQAVSNCDVARALLCLEPGPSEPTGQKWTTPGSIVFATSVDGTGNLGSWAEAGGATALAAGDAICRNLAAAAHLPAPEQFVAWLSDSSIDAANRVTSNGPFRRIDGVVIATSKADLLDGANSGSIHQDETGDYLSAAEPWVWTGTDAFGNGTGADCANWTTTAPIGGRLGDVSGQYGESNRFLDGRWSDFGDSGAPCFAQMRLYCISNRTTLFWDGFDLTDDWSRWSSVAP